MTCIANHRDWIGPSGNISSIVQRGSVKVVIHESTKIQMLNEWNDEGQTINIVAYKRFCVHLHASCITPVNQSLITVNLPSIQPTFPFQAPASSSIWLVGVVLGLWMAPWVMLSIINPIKSIPLITTVVFVSLPVWAFSSISIPAPAPAPAPTSASAPVISTQRVT